MLTYFCKDSAAQCVKTIVDSGRCGLCDTAVGSRLRFACGHSACGDCVETVGDCPTCTPIMDSSSSRPVSDEPQTERVKQASELLTSFQDAFQMDVYLSKRISDRLKLEKELFPECIQAPHQYFNKRKSLNISKKGKENRNSTFLPGEGISSSKEVNKSRDFVQAWLNKSSPPTRSPLSDLKVNTYKKPKTQSTATKSKNHNEVKPTRQSNKKRSQLKPLSTSTPQSSLEHYLKPVDKGAGKNAWVNDKSLKRKLDYSSDIHTVLGKKQCDESGIEIDDCFTIEDTQDQVIDKDRQALLEIENADKQITQSVKVIEDTQVKQAANSELASTSGDNCVKNIIKVPFYRKSYLHKTCKQCINSSIMKPEANDTDGKRNSDVSITVDNKSFKITIQVVDCKQSNYDRKQSAAVQTDLREPFLGFDNSAQKDESVTMISKIQDYIQSEAMFTEDNVTETDSQKTSCINVASMNKGDCIENHHNEHAYGILTEMGGAGFQNKRRKAKRGVTPDSNNSSDKENFDPNRMKKKGREKKKKTNK